MSLNQAPSLPPHVKALLDALLARLPEPWRATVERSPAWRGELARDDSYNPEVRRFALWAAAQGDRPAS